MEINCTGVRYDVERVAIDHEKDLGAEMGMLYLSKNMYSYRGGICKGEVRFIQRSIKKSTNTEQDWKQQLIINSRNLEQI
jgi:hypothetical protein